VGGARFDRAQFALFWLVIQSHGLIFECSTGKYFYVTHTCKIIVNCNIRLLFFRDKLSSVSLLRVSFDASRIEKKLPAYLHHLRILKRFSDDSLGSNRSLLEGASENSASKSPRVIKSKLNATRIFGRNFLFLRKIFPAFDVGFIES
jgi:hypothetical protein